MEEDEEMPDADEAAMNGHANKQQDEEEETDKVKEDKPEQNGKKRDDGMASTDEDEDNGSKLHRNKCMYFFIPSFSFILHSYI